MSANRAMFALMDSQLFYHNLLNGELLASSGLGLLLDMMLKAIIVLALAGFGCFALRRASAATRHLVWSLALISLLALPLLSAILPDWQLPILPQCLRSLAPAAPASMSTAVSAQTSAPRAASLEPAKPIKSTESRKGLSAPVAAAPAAGREDGALITAPATDSTAPAASLWSLWLLLLWAGGVMIVLARMLIGNVSVWWLARRAQPITNPGWIKLTQALAGQLRLTRAVVLLKSDRVSMPLTWGLLRSFVSLPADADQWPLARRQIVLLHELSHVKRRDCLTQTLAQVACALYWFNPLVWLAARQLRLERERACDDQVLAAGTKASDYAGHLLALAGARADAGCSSMAALAIARRSQLEERLLAILNPKISRSGINAAASIFAALLVAILILPLAAIRPAVQAAEQSSQLSQLSQPSQLFQPSQAARAGEKSFTPQLREVAPLADRPAAGRPMAQAHVQGQPATAQSRPAGQHSDVSVAVAALKEALQDADKDVRQYAATALAQVGDPYRVAAAEALSTALRDKEWQVRAQAAWALGLIGDQRALKPLNALLKDENPQVRRKAAWAFGMLLMRHSEAGADETNFNRQLDQDVDEDLDNEEAEEVEDELEQEEK